MALRRDTQFLNPVSRRNALITHSNIQIYQRFPSQNINN